MKGNFLTIALTRPDFFPRESEIIEGLLSSGKVSFVHIRKPGASSLQIEKLIEQIDASFHPFLKLHDAFSLIEKYSLGGIHLNSRNPEPYPGTNSISISFHNLKDIENSDSFDYFFISPVYDSISKKGYNAKFNLKVLSENIKGKKAIALGGVTPEKIPELKDLGFIGAAMLGYYFP
ncbi:MAG: thiamine phosphate synthase [Muribaculaceae bacterium]|nr:thiamine phosphate synthase [Muribaculaceae bacterium]